MLELVHNKCAQYIKKHNQKVMLALQNKLSAFEH